MGKVWVVGLLLVSLFHNGFSHCSTPIDKNHNSDLIMIAKVVRKQVVKKAENVNDTAQKHGAMYLFEPLELLKGRRFSDTLFISFIESMIGKSRNPYFGNYAVVNVNQAEDPNTALGDTVILYFIAIKNSDGVVYTSYNGFESYEKLDRVKEKILESPSTGLNEDRRHKIKRHGHNPIVKPVPTIGSTRRFFYNDTTESDKSGLSPEEEKLMKELEALE